MDVSGVRLVVSLVSRLPLLLQGVLNASLSATGLAASAVGEAVPATFAIDVATTSSTTPLATLVVVADRSLAATLRAI